MKKQLLIGLLTLVILVSAAPLLKALETDYEATVERVRSFFLDPGFHAGDCKTALVEILDVSAAILPEKTYAAEFKAKIAWVRDSIAEGHLFSPKIRQYLGLAYQLVSNGESWQLPEEHKKPYPGEKTSLEQAKKTCGRFLESALAEMKAGNNEKAVRRLIDFVIMVITPIEA